jgi:hypothetical protein
VSNEQEDLGESVDGEEGERGANLNARLMVWWSSPLFRFVFRAAIPIVLVIVVAIIVGSH